MLFRPLVCGVIRSGRERETRNENYRVEREGDPFGHAPAFAESNRDFRSPPRESPSGASSTGRNARHPRSLQLRGNGRKNGQFASQSSKCLTLRPIHKYVCYFARAIRLHSPGCHAASNPMGRGVFVRARRDPCARLEPRSLVASIVQVYSLLNNLEMIKSEKLNLIISINFLYL